MDMNVSAGNPVMRELKTANHLIGDHKALQEAFDRDGYWFFRDVLDQNVIAKIRGVYLDYLVEMGLTDPNDPEHAYNGADYANLPINSNQSKLNDIRADKLLHEAPTINEFFARLFGCEPFWLPFTVHRTNPPVVNRDRARLDFIHEDGIFNVGLPFIICWVPLDVIDADVGGLALVEGVQNGPCLHRKEGMKIFPIAAEDVPAGTWRTTVYRPGDVLLMGRHTPHSGLSNISNNRFRLSMDARIMPSSGNVPYVGHVIEVSAETVTVRDAKGDHTLKFNAGSFVRGKQGDQMPLADIPARYPAGLEVIVAHDGDIVTNMRPVT
jgi:1-deoxypentalenic acid 11beta-hydroxylase